MLLVLAGLLCLTSIATRESLPFLVSLWLLAASWWWPSPFRGGSVSAEVQADGRASSTPERVSSDLGERRIKDALHTISQSADSLFRRLAAVKLAQLGREIDDLVVGKVLFRDTEGWRTAYADLLLNADIGEYRSVAWVTNEEYWRDAPGEHSMRTNFEAIDRGLVIERICILGRGIWPPDTSLPMAGVQKWLSDQHYRGISIWLVRESDLGGEPDLIKDFGIYGNRATGEQQLDEQSRTAAFTLSFDPLALRLAQERWERLKLFAKNLGDLVDRTGLPL